MAINVFTASGNLGGDCEVFTTQGGKNIASFSLPVKSGWGENEKTNWVTCKMFGAKADKLPQYLTKGKKIIVSGSFELEQWEKDGAKHSKPVIIVNDIDFGDSGKGGGQQAAPQQGGQQYSQSQQAPPHDDFGDSEIPF